jgi:plasmid stabilization system protein ParE
LYYELHGDDILILAVWHGRRNSRGWRERSSS